MCSEHFINQYVRGTKVYYESVQKMFIYKKENNNVITHEIVKKKSFLVVVSELLPAQFIYVQVVFFFNFFF